MVILNDRLLSSLPLINPGKNAAEWEKKRDAILSEVVNLEYGGMPPNPETLRVEQLQCLPNHPLSTKVYVNEKFSFMMQVFRPEKLKDGKKYPVILNGDGCFRTCNDVVIDDAISRGYVVAKFNRVEFAPDINQDERRGGIYDMYPDLCFGAISAWAWGYSRAMDALETIDFVDIENVAITGHSRGGKTVLLAGAVDKRFAVVNPNNSGCCGAGCFRYRTEPCDGKSGNERLEDILDKFAYWFGPELDEYIGRDHELPFDQHFLKAAVAPRKLLETNGRDDTWANPKGSYITFEAAKEIYELYGVPENIAYLIREGGHAHTPDDFAALLTFIEDRSTVPEGYLTTPF